MVHARDHYFKHLGVADGLSQLCISSIYQDELGAMWLGTTEGLNRYNGKDVKIFRPSRDNEGLTNNEINGLCGDKKGRMYIRSGYDLIKLDIYKEQFTCLRRGGVNGIFCKGDTLWVNCGKGIYQYTDGDSDLTLVTWLNDKVGGNLYVDDETIWIVTGYSLIAVSRKNPDQQEIIFSFSKGGCVSGDSSGNIWVGSWDGLFCVSADRKIIHYTSRANKDELSNNQVRCILEDDFKRIWVGTFHGIDCYDPKTDKWSHYTRYGNTSNTLSHCSVLSLHKDVQGNIWVGTYYGGVNIFNPDKDSHHFYSAEPLSRGCLSFPVVGKMTADSEGKLWICTEGGGLNRYDPDMGNFIRFQYRVRDSKSIGSNNLKSIFYRKENNSLYVGAHLGGLFVLDLNSNQGYRVQYIKGDSSSLPHEIVNDIQEYKGGLALLTQGGPVFMDPVTKKFSPLSEDAEVQELVNRQFAYETFLIDSRERMWLASASRGVVRVDLPSSKVTRYTMNNNDTSSVQGKVRAVHIFEDDKGDIYFCTIGSGILKYQEHGDTFKVYDTFNKILPSDYCYYICKSPILPVYISYMEKDFLFLIRRKKK